MENLLKAWLEDETQKRIRLCTSTVMAKAKSFLVPLKEKAGPDYAVASAASSEWFKQFRNCY